MILIFLNIIQVSYGLVDYYDYYSDSNNVAPQIFIECIPEKQNKLIRTFLSELRNFVEEENQSLEEEIDYYDFLEIKTKRYENGIAFYISSCDCCIPDFCRIDPIGDPLAVVTERVKKKYPDVEINAAFLYHINEGSVYGYDMLWLDGDARKSAALLLNFAMKQDSFWDEEGWKECSYDGGYEGLLSIVLDLHDCMICDDILDVFISHIPKDDADRRDDLMKRIQEYLKSEI